MKLKRELFLELIAGEIVESGKAVTYYLEKAKIPYNELPKLRGYIIAVAGQREGHLADTLGRLAGEIYLNSWRVWYNKLLTFRLDPLNDDKEYVEAPRL